MGKIRNQVAPATAVESAIVAVTEETSVTTEVNGEVIHNSPAVASNGNKKYDVPKLFEQFKTKSAVIRFLSSEGLEAKEIHKILKDGGVTNAQGDPIIYQHVYNVLNQKLRSAETKPAESKELEEPTESTESTTETAE